MPAIPWSRAEEPAQVDCRRSRRKTARPQRLGQTSARRETILASRLAGTGLSPRSTFGLRVRGLRTEVLGSSDDFDDFAFALDSSARVLSSSARTLASSSSSWRIKLPPTTPRARARAFRQSGARARKAAQHCCFWDASCTRSPPGQGKLSRA